RGESRRTAVSIVPTTLTTSAPKKADQNPSTWNPNPSDDDTALVSHSIRPFTTSRNNPSVTRMKGKASTHVTGGMTALTTPKVSATPKNASQSPSNDTPGTMRVATQSAAALTSRRIVNDTPSFYRPPDALNAGA